MSSYLMRVASFIPKQIPLTRKIENSEVQKYLQERGIPLTISNPGLVSRLFGLKLEMSNPSDIARDEERQLTGEEVQKWRNTIRFSFNSSVMCVNGRQGEEAVTELYFNMQRATSIKIELDGKNLVVTCSYNDQEHSQNVIIFTLANQ